MLVAPASAETTETDPVTDGAEALAAAENEGLAPVNVMQRARCSCLETLAVRCAARRNLPAAACPCRCHKTPALENCSTIAA